MLEKIFKKGAKKGKKSVDKRKFRCYISRAPVREANEFKSQNKKVLGKTKKVLDKRNSKCYYIQADADEADARCTLKIEQCKKKLMLNKHQRRVLTTT